MNPFKNSPRITSISKMFFHKEQMLVFVTKPMMPRLQPRTIVAAAAETQLNADINLRELCDEGRVRDALDILQRTNLPVKPCTYALFLEGCIKNKALPEGKLIHAHMHQSETIPDTSLLNTLLDMYVHCGALIDARKVFDEIPQRDDFSWNVMIAAYARLGIVEEAMNVFYQMQRTGTKPNHFTFVSILLACADLKALEQGKEIHENIAKGDFESDVFVSSALIDMYGKCGRIEDARELFDKMHKRDVVSWTSMIAGYAQNGRGEEALDLFHQMQMTGVKPNLENFVSVLPACASLAALKEGMEIHGELIQCGFRADAFMESALIDMYAKCGSIEKARKVFDDTWRRDVVLWTVMITAYAQYGLEEEALKLFRQMRAAGVKPNAKTFTSVLPACANLAALEQGMEIHGEIIRFGFHSDAFLESTLIDMYAKCGSIEEARELFDTLHQQDIVSWTAMIAGYAMHGCSKEALDLFQQMRDSGMNPDHVSLVCILSACCHAGLVDEGYQYFKSMSEHYHITPAMEHYSCMVDLLGRAGRLDEVHKFIDKMPIEPDAIVWRSLLGACSIHINLELGEHAAAHLFELDPKNASLYVLLSNIYAAPGRWSDIVKLRKTMKDKGVQKLPGCSWIEVNKQVHTFNVGDRSHPQMQRIYTKLETLSREMKAAGYVPDTNFALNDVEECSWIEGNKQVDTFNVGDRSHPQMQRIYTKLETLSREMKAAGYVPDTNFAVNDVVECSWIEVNEQVHTFNVGDRSHPQMQRIYTKLETLSREMKAAGYVPDTNFALNDVEECSWIEVNKQVHTFNVGDRSHPQMQRIFTKLEQDTLGTSHGVTFENVDLPS